MFALASASPADIMPLCFEGLGILPAGRFKFGRDRKSETPPFHFPESPIPPSPLIFSYHITSVKYPVCDYTLSPWSAQWTHHQPLLGQLRARFGIIAGRRRGPSRIQLLSVFIRTRRGVCGVGGGGKGGGARAGNHTKPQGNSARLQCPRNGGPGWPPAPAGGRRPHRHDLGRLARNSAGRKLCPAPQSQPAPPHTPGSRPRHLYHRRRRPSGPARQQRLPRSPS